MKSVFSLLLLGLISATSLRIFAQEALTIHVVTEDAYPLQYLESVEGQATEKLVGPAYDIVKQVLAQAELPYQAQVLPWARAYALATTQPNTLIFSIARTTTREQEFYWIGSLMELTYSFYGLKQQFPEEAYLGKNLKDKRIGTILDSATYQYLTQQGFNNLYAVSNPKQNYEKLLSGRIDLFPANTTSFHVSCVKFEIDCSMIKPIAPLGLPTTHLYFALSKQTDKAIVTRIKNAYQQLIDNQVVTSNSVSLLMQGAL